jgi:phosphatidylglycerophosphatase C
VSAPGRPIAAFDLDGTLTRRDTLLPFLASVVPRPRLVRALADQALRVPAAVARGALDRDALKERLLVRVFAGTPRDAIDAAGAAYGRRLAERGISPAMRERLAWHRAEEHHIVIVSASLDVYVREVARALEVDDAMASTLEFDADGRCTGRLLGGNCRGAEKARRLRTLLDGGASIAYAYGNSRGDREMLALAAQPIRVRRGRIVARGGERSSPEGA